MRKAVLFLKTCQTDSESKGLELYCLFSRRISSWEFVFYSTQQIRTHDHPTVSLVKCVKRRTLILTEKCLFPINASLLPL